MTQMGLDIEAIEHLDFDFAPPCDWNEGECDKAAEWKAVTSCCGFVFLFCDPHKQKQMRLIEEAMANGNIMNHDGSTGCGAEDVKFIVIERIT